MIYFKGTQDYRFSYRQCITEKMILGYCDADSISSNNDRYCAVIIHSRSRKDKHQRCQVVLSSCMQGAVWLGVLS